MGGIARRLHGDGETICKYFARSGCACARERLEHHAVALLWIRRAIPGAMEGDEYAVTIARRELLLVIVDHGVRRPMRGKRSGRSGFGGANSDLVAAVSAVFRRQH